MQLVLFNLELSLKNNFYLKVTPYIYMVNKKSDVCIFANDLS